MVKAKEYSMALAEALRDKNEHEAGKILEHMRSLLGARGEGRMFHTIIRGALDLLQRDQKIRGAEVVLAREEDGAKQRDAIAGDLHASGVTEYTTRIDDSLIGGYIVRAKGTMRDRSVRRTLLDLYASLTV